MNNEIVKYSVGCDMDSKKNAACIMTIDNGQRVKVKATRSFDNTSKGHCEFLKWVVAKHKDRSKPICFVMEATGNYNESLAYLLHQEGLNVSVVLANKAKKYKQALGLHSKNDRIDAKGLAQMGAEQNLHLWQPISPLAYELKKLTRHRQSLQEHITAIKSQVHAEKYAHRPNKIVQKQHQQLLKKLQKFLTDLEDQIQLTLAEDQPFHRKVFQIADSVKGLGWLTVLIVAVETNGFSTFENLRQLTSFAGYDVIENQSGKRIGKSRISKRGNAHIRRALYFPAINVVRFQTGPFPAFFNRILQRSKIYKKANVAVQRKLLCLIYTLWKKDVPFDPQYHLRANLEAHKKGSPPKQATQDELQLAYKS